MPQYPKSEEVIVLMPGDLYEEIFECEIDGFDIVDIELSSGLRGSRVQFIQGMLTATRADEAGDREVAMTQDGLDYFIQDLLPDVMEMWYSNDNYELISSAREFLGSLGLSCPY